MVYLGGFDTFEYQSPVFQVSGTTMAICSVGSYAIDFTSPSEPKTFKEKLQTEIDQWLSRK